MEAIPKFDIKSVTKSDIRFDISIKRTTWIRAIDSRFQLHLSMCVNPKGYGWGGQNDLVRRMSVISHIVIVTKTDVLELFA